MDEIMGTMDGRVIVAIRTMRSKYDDGKWVELMDDQANMYRMDVNQFLKVVNEMEFQLTRKRRYIHLTMFRKTEEAVSV